MTYVPASASHESFPCGGLLVQTLGSLWFFESQNSDVITSTNQDTSQERDPIVASSFGVVRTFKPNKLPIEGKKDVTILSSVIVIYILKVKSMRNTQKMISIFLL